MKFPIQEEILFKSYWGQNNQSDISTSTTQQIAEAF